MEKIIKIKLIEEEVNSLIEGKGKEVSIYDDDNIKVIISYNPNDTDLNEIDKLIEEISYEDIEKKIEDINMQIQELAEEKIKLEHKLEGIEEED